MKYSKIVKKRPLFLPPQVCEKNRFFPKTFLAHIALKNPRFVPSGDPILDPFLRLPDPLFDHF